MSTDRAAQQAIGALIRKHQLSAYLNPGGAEFRHPTAGRLQIPACSLSEDLELLQDWLRNAGLET